jgi:hypothetical protein
MTQRPKVAASSEEIMRHLDIQTRSLPARTGSSIKWQSVTHVAIAVAAFVFVGAVTLGIL